MKKGWVSARRLDLANSSTCMLKLAETRVVGGKAQGWWAGRPGIANLSTCALKLAEPRVVGAQGDSVLQIWALAHSNLQDQGWWMHRGTQFCQFAELGVVGGWGGLVLPIQALAHLNLQDRGEWLVGQRRGHSVLPIRAFACSNLQDRGWWMCRRTWFCQFKHASAQIFRTRGSRWAGKLGFANSSTCALEFAGPRVVGAQGDSVLQNQAQKCSNLQAQGGGEVGEARSKDGRLREVPICRFEHASAQICKPGVAGSWVRPVATSKCRMRCNIK